MKLSISSLFTRLVGAITLLALFASLFSSLAQTKSSTTRSAAPPAASSTTDDLATSQSEMRGMLERYATDLGSLNRFFAVQNSTARVNRFRHYYEEWLARLAPLNFDAMSQDGKIDYVIFKSELEYQLRQLDIQTKQFAEIEPLVPFAKALMELEEARRRLENIDPAKTATLLTNLKKQIDDTRKSIEEKLKAAAAQKKTEPDPQAKFMVEGLSVRKTAANRAAAAVTSLRETVRRWFGYYNGYDPMFTWWVSEPHKQLDQAMEQYAQFLRDRLVGVKPDDKTTIIGDPIGREALMSELQREMIPYTPEELIEIAKKELAWCDAEMLKASRELGYGDDWQKALEHVKGLYVEPGKQPEMIRQLAIEAQEYVEKNNLVTVPPLARDTWRMEMMTPERQLTSPFFLGGEIIQVSYPTNTMSHEAKMMSMRGNNPHFSRATVHHELIPGHHLQGFMLSRYRTYRGMFRTPFWMEGWALYWEMLLWDRGFPKTPENKIGMLFWRMHRSARIMFSLGFHLGLMTPQECVDLLVKRVGHELDNATAEVRRSFAGDYGPLYQAAYLLGGLQFRQLHRDLVDSAKMTDRDFHDTILKGGSVPVEMVRASLTKTVLTRDYKPGWKFYGDVSVK